MIRGIIMLEGPDGGGKTTLAKALVDRFDAFYIHGRVHKEVWRYHVAAARLAAKKSQHGLVVIDRNWLSECIYGPVFRDTNGYHPGERSLDRVFLKHATLHIMCLPHDHDELIANFDRLRERRREHYTSVRAVAARYRDFFDGNPDASFMGNYATQLAHLGGVARLRHDWMRYDWMQQGNHIDTFCDLAMHQLGELRERQYQPALEHDHPNVVGHLASAKVLFVGEALGDPTGPVEWPFCARCNSPEFLNRNLHIIGWNEADSMMTNMLHRDQHLSALVHKRPRLRVVTLGRVPERLAKRVDIKPHRELNHPQYERRFNQHGRLGYQYFEKLAEATSDV